MRKVSFLLFLLLLLSVPASCQVKVAVGFTLEEHTQNMV